MEEENVVHFTLGDRTGQLLMQIAQEHLIYSHDPKKAVNAIMQSMIGIDLDLAMKILKGDMVLLVEENQFIVTEFDESIHGTVFPRLDCTDYSRRKAQDIHETGKNLIRAIEQIKRNMRYGSLNITFPYETILDFLDGDDKTILEDILEDERVLELSMIIRSVKAFMERSVKELSSIHFMEQTWPEEFTDSSRVYPSYARSTLKDLMREFSDMMKTDYAKLTREAEVHDAQLNAFLDATKEIDKIIDEGIMPVDIMDNYSAGWLSPEGEYYALNGEIANMLHNQIADALIDKGIIPDLEETKFEGNADSWLQSEGWVRIHGRDINFEGHMNERISRGENKFITDKQIDMITEYCRLHHNGVVKVFFQEISAIMFRNMIKGNPTGFYQKYLNW